MKNTIVYLPVTFFACTSTPSDSHVSGSVPLVVAVGSQTLADCPNGGVELNWGVDGNGNGELESAEVSRTYAVCHGEDGEGGTATEVTKRRTAFSKSS